MGLAPGQPPGHPRVGPGVGGQDVCWVHPSVYPRIHPQLLSCHLPCHVLADVPDIVREVANLSSRSRSFGNRFRRLMHCSFSRLASVGAFDCDYIPAGNGLLLGMWDSDGLKARNSDASTVMRGPSAGVVTRVASGHLGNSEANSQRGFAGRLLPFATRRLSFRAKSRNLTAPDC
jgi:hypothetical protein